MGKRSERNTKGKIASAAWTLFSEKGYDNTTIEDIIEASGTSRGSFYHYFEGKDSLIASMTFVLDEEYQRMEERLDPAWSAGEKLLFMDLEICRFMENQISVEMVTRLTASQLVTGNARALLDRNRYYYRLLRNIVEEGLQKGELHPEYTVNDIVKAFSVLERGLMYDWCLCRGEYSLTDYARKLMPLYLEPYVIRKDE